MSGDETFGIMEIERNKTLGGFIHKFSAMKGEAVLLGDPSVLQLANKLLNKGSAENPGAASAQVLNYDTTFKLGDTYCSTLVMKNTYFENDPVFPVLTMLHETKENNSMRKCGGQRSIS